DYLIVGIDAESEEDAVFEASRPIPIYPASAAVPTWRIARAVRIVLDPLGAEDVPDPIPEAVRDQRGLVSLLEALRDVHLPVDEASWQRGQPRLIYEEALVLQAALARRRAASRSLTSVARVGGRGLILDALDARLPFPLTAGQRHVGA